MRDETVRAALQEHVVPAQSPTFFDDLWELVHAREHAAAVRWRRISVVLGCIALAALAAASVLAAPHGSNVVDQTVTCELQMQGGIPVLNVGTRARSPLRGGMGTYTYTEPAEVSLTTGGDAFQGHRLLYANTEMKGFLLDTSLCSETKAKVPLARAGLPSTGDLRRGYKGIELRCLGPARVTIHFHLVQNAKGSPTSAELAARITRTDKPLFFIDWSAQAVRTYGSPRCSVGEY